MIVAYIDAHIERFGVDPICRVLTEHGMAIAPSTCYARQAVPVSTVELVDAYAANAVLDCWTANRGVYGVRKLWHALRREGHHLGRDQVGRLVGIVGISGAVRGEHRTRTPRRDPARAGTRTWCNAAGTCSPDQTSGGLPTSPMSGRSPASSTSPS